jgi:hypothetical protein
VFDICHQAVVYEDIAVSLQPAVAEFATLRRQYLLY